MCSIDNDYLTEESKIVNHNENIDQKFNACHKCRTNIPRVVLRKKDAYCKECFLIGTTHKFKAQLGKSKLIRPLDRVLVYHKVGHAGTALLHLLRAGLDLNTPKKIRFEPIIIFVDDFRNLNNEERTTFLKNVCAEIITFGFKPHLISYCTYLNHSGGLEDIIATDLNLYNFNKSSKNLSKKHISSTKNHDLKNIYLRDLLTNCAKYFKCKFVFTPENSLDISVLLLTNICLGRGSDISDDTGFSDTRNEEVKILRPLRIIDIKELVFYNMFNKLEPISIKPSDDSPYDSVQDLTLKFVNDLKTCFPATVSTILKTSEKIAAAEPGISCKFCKSVKHSQQNQITSEESTMFSKLVSTETLNYSMSRQDRYDALLEKFLVKSNSVEHICYACTKLIDCIEK